METINLEFRKNPIKVVEECLRKNGDKIIFVTVALGIVLGIIFFPGTITLVTGCKLAALVEFIIAIIPKVSTYLNNFVPKFSIMML